MAIRRYVDRHCLDCHGNGEVMETKIHEGEYWTAFFTCHCVTYETDEATKRAIRAALSATERDTK